MSAWAPKSQEELKAAILECLKLSPTDCSKGPHGPIGSWDVSAVTDMNDLFVDANRDPVPGTDKFNGDVSNWDVSRVTRMKMTFAHASSFNGDLSKWYVSRVTSMEAMFAFASSFNGALSKWDVSEVTTMETMFAYASSFNRYISEWDVSKVTNMKQMFAGASSFARTLCGAWRTSTADKDSMFDGSFGRICTGRTTLMTATTPNSETTSVKTLILALINPNPDCDHNFPVKLGVILDVISTLTVFLF